MACRLRMSADRSYALIFFFKQETAYEMRMSDWSSDVCSSDLFDLETRILFGQLVQGRGQVLFLAAGGCLNGQAEHRFGIVQWPQMDVIVVVRIVHDGVEMDVVDLGDRGNVASDGHQIGRAHV